MIPQIKKILYTTDLSPNSAKKHDASINILYIMEKISITTEAMLSSYLHEKQQKVIFEQKTKYIMDRIRKRLKIFCEKELKDEPNLINRIESIEICEGFPANEILKKADELYCDVIVMGTHGKGVLSQTFLGSVTKRVLKRTRKPVFIIPLPKGDIDITFHDI